MGQEHFGVVVPFKFIRFTLDKAASSPLADQPSVAQEERHVQNLAQGEFL